MKKLLIIITLFVSSFFLFCNKEVKAYEYIKEVDFSIMEDVIALKEKLNIYVAEDSTLSDYYIIYFDQGTIAYYVLKSSVDSLSFSYSSDSFSIKIPSTMKSGTNLDVINPSSSVSSKVFYIYSTNTYRTNSLILYTNLDLFHSSNHSIVYNYQNFSYVDSFSYGSKFNSLYDIYIIYQEYLGIEQENPHQEEIDKVTNFYTMVIEKIEYLANEISNNYIFLFVIGIFIVTFVFLLIFRRFL